MGIEMMNRIVKCLTLSLTGLILSFTGCRNAVWEITPENIFESYRVSVGNEYEDTLILDLFERYGREIVIYDSAELSIEDLENRNGKVIVERCNGKVTSREMDGRVLNPYDVDYSYISYRSYTGSEKLREGTLMLTYLVYNPDSNYCDDIIERYDCVVSHELED